MIKANRGEWSEFYAFVKILSDGKLFAADSNLQKIEEKSFSVLNIKREEKKGNEVVYGLTSQNESISISEKGMDVAFVEKSKLKTSVVKIFDEIKNSSTRTFSSPTSNSIMLLLRCEKIKAASNKKEDINITIMDRVASVESTLGFSIKSMLGGASTLLNASTHTNFIYCTENSQSAVIQKNSSGDRIRDKISDIAYNFGNLSFLKVPSLKFSHNLSMIDSNFSQILGEIVLAYYQGKAKTFPEIIDYLAGSGILENKLRIDKAIIKHKVKDFLVAVALGMNPGHLWEGDTLAHGGYIIVKDDGDVVCYNLYNRDEFKEYLYNNTFLDTPSTTRHKFGMLYDEDGRKCINLNLQIRFKK